MKSKPGSPSITISRHQVKWLFLPSAQSVIYHFNAIIKSIGDYYSGSTQKSVLNKFYFALRKSAALTLGYRCRNKSAPCAFETYDKDLTIQYTNKKKKEVIIQLNIPSYSTVKWNLNSNTNSNAVDVLPSIQGVSIPKTLNIICSASELSCAIPGCVNQAEHWHHVKHQKKMKGKDRQKHLLALTAKRIPVCKPHHHLIHSGKYDGPSLKKMKGYALFNFD